jgi:hypothetical protein
MATLISQLLLWYSITAVIGFILLFFRDDRTEIMRDLKRGYRKTLFVGVLHTIAIGVLLPLTIPFSFGRIINRWL